MTDQEKLYYSIREVSRLTDTQAYTLRYWEKEFPKLKPKKSKKGQRTYTKKDIEIIKAIKDLLYERGYTIKGARDKLKKLPLEKASSEKEPSRVKTPTASLPSAAGDSLKSIQKDLLAIRERLTALLEKEGSLVTSS